MEFHERLQGLRLRSGLSASALAAKVGVSPTCMWNWERGNTHPRAHNMVALAAALRVSSAELTGHTSPSAASSPLNSDSQGLTTVDSILEEAKAQLAEILRLPRERIELSFSVAV